MAAKFPALAHLAEFVLYSGLQDNTRRGYAAKIKHYVQFCTEAQVEPFPATLETLSYYAVWRVFVHGKRNQHGNKADGTVTYDTLKGDITAILSYHTDMNLPCEAFGLPAFLRLKRGLHMILGERKDSRAPLTVPLLKKILAIMPANSLGNCLYRAAMTCAVFGLMRLSELVKVQNQDPSRLLRMANIDFHEAGHGGYLSINLVASKSDLWRKGVSIPLPCVCGNEQDVPCPKHEVEQYLQARRAAELPTRPMDPLWMFAEGNVLIGRQLVQQMKDLLRLIGVDPTHYTGHSFRKGGAQSAHDAGLPYEVLQYLGRWHSDACKLYYGTPVQEVAQNLRQLVFALDTQNQPLLRH